VVAIIGILAAIAIPSFTRFQLRSKVSEGKLNLAAIRAAELAYFAENGTYIGLTPSGGNSPPSSTKGHWFTCPSPITMASPGHCILGYEPEGASTPRSSNAPRCSTHREPPGSATRSAPAGSGWARRSSDSWAHEGNLPTPVEGSAGDAVARRP